MSFEDILKMAEEIGRENVSARELQSSGERQLNQSEIDKIVEEYKNKQ